MLFNIFRSCNLEVTVVYDYLYILTSLNRASGLVL